MERIFFFTFDAKIWISFLSRGNAAYRVRYEYLADKTHAGRGSGIQDGNIKQRSSRTIDSHEAKRQAAAVNWKYVKDNKTISHKT